MSHSSKYKQVVASQRWKELRASLISNHGGCERCCLITEKLELHHKHYDTLGDESVDDVELLCEMCHKKADMQRRSESRKKQYKKRMDAWATKRYGEMWEMFKDEDDIEQEFDEWIERRERFA